MRGLDSSLTLKKQKKHVQEWEFQKQIYFFTHFTRIINIIRWMISNINISVGLVHFDKFI